MKNELNYKWKKFTDIIIFLAIFIAFLIFYRVYPLCIYDMDDWSFIADERHAVPSMLYLNPIKVFPETLMPFVSFIGVHLIAPIINNDYINGMAIAYAICVSLFIAIYFYMFFRLFLDFFKLECVRSVLLTVTIILAHFLVYVPIVSKTDVIPYFFYTANVSCIFHYVIPFLLNSTLVLNYIRNGYLLRIYISADCENKKHSIDLIYNSVMILCIYLSIASNMFHNGILIVWLGTELLISFISIVLLGNKRNSEKDKNQYKHSKVAYDGIKIRIIHFLKINIISILVILFWIICCFFEINGRRAKSIAQKLDIAASCNRFISSIKSFGFLFLFGCIAVCLIFVVNVIIMHSKKKAYLSDGKILLLILKECIAFFVMVIYLILLDSKVGYGLERQDVICSWLWYVILIVFTMACYLIKEYPKIFVAVPLIMYILVFETVIDGNRYPYVNFSRSNNIKAVKAFDDSIIEQVLDAQDKGFGSVEIHVPYYGGGDNFPMATYGGEYISKSLYCLGVTYKKMDITIIPDNSVNEKYLLDIY